MTIDFLVDMKARRLTTHPLKNKSHGQVNEVAFVSGYQMGVLSHGRDSQSGLLPGGKGHTVPEIQSNTQAVEARTEIGRGGGHRNFYLSHTGWDSTIE
jgi:hypothetical protein